VDYEALPARIRRADILLGVFGTTQKASRVIPNKVFQALASGKPLVTRRAAAYPDKLIDTAGKGIVWLPPGDAAALANALAELAANPRGLSEMGRQARATFDGYFSEAAIKSDLAEALRTLG
jgi:glycosyltransferase involved in cell wall biosynthesis